MIDEGELEGFFRATALQYKKKGKEKKEVVDSRLVLFATMHRKVLN
ncbi:MAG: hypothetical protein QW220_00065 [Candidatus Bathyarchaeia archaeon]